MTSLETMYPQTVGNRAVKLASPFVAGTDTTISLSLIDASAVPDAPNHVTLLDKVSDAEQYLLTVDYTSISGTTLEGVTVNQYDIVESATHTFPVNTPVFHPFAETDYDAITSNIESLNDGKVDLSGTSATTGVALGVDPVTGELYYEV